jgi:hypothetical protein
MENEEELYSIISVMKEAITMIVGTVLGAGIELPRSIIDRYAHILGASILQHKSILPQEIFNLLNDILKLPQISELSKGRLDKIKSIQHRFYTKYSLAQSKHTQFEGRAEKTGLAPFNIGPAAMTMTVAEPSRGIMNLINMAHLPQAQAREIPVLNVNPTYAPLVNKKSKSRRRTKSANHKSKSKTPRRRSA